MNVRYGARPVEAVRNRELEATGRQVWSDSLEAVYLTDAEVVAAVLPPPLEPGPEPLVRLNISTVSMPGDHVFGAGWFGVQARHGDLLGEYPLLMPMSTEQATVGGRETFGEPKKIAQITADRNGDSVYGVISRMGFTVSGSRPPASRSTSTSSSCPRRKAPACSTATRSSCIPTSTRRSGRSSWWMAR